jgi:hypothetical protein
MKNSQELRSFLVEQMQCVADGSTSGEKAKAICNIAQQIYNTLNIEVKTALAKTKMEGIDVKPVAFSD